MIISHKFRFIFLKTNKTASTSTEIALSKFCGPEDIITPISEPDQEIRSSLNYPGPQNFLYQQGERRNSIRGSRDLAEENYKFYNHISAGEIMDVLDSSIWHGYFKFCVERNPWDRVVSLYYFRYPSTPRPTFSEFVASDAIGVLKRKGYELYTSNGCVLVDKICRYESLNADLESVRKFLRIPERLELPNAKAGLRPSKRHYRDYYDGQTEWIVRDLFSDEIQLHDYSF